MKIKGLLCVFGFHHWRTTTLEEWERARWNFVCRRCGKKVKTAAEAR